MKKKILIAEDNDETRELFAHNLELAGYEVAPFADCESAFEFLSSGESVNCLMLDFEFVGETESGQARMSGLDFMRLVRERLPSLPVLMISRARERGKAAFEMGKMPPPAAYLDKPVGFEEISETISSLLEAAESGRYATLEEKLNKLRREEIESKLRETRGNVKRSAALLGLEARESLRYWLRIFKIDPKEFKEGKS